jgi:ribonuclease HII
MTMPLRTAPQLLPFFEPAFLEAGVDEVGRGCLAGPVVAAAVILKPDFHLPGLRDSKKLSATKRQSLRAAIEDQALAFAIAEASPTEIDQINILQATFLAMHRAIRQLVPRPQLLLVDGNRFKPFPEVSHQCFVKGDDRYAAIAAASVLAKTYRDALMADLHHHHPDYGWDTNMGYPAPKHVAAIAKFGQTTFHRKSFQLKALQINLFSAATSEAAGND